MGEWAQCPNCLEGFARKEGKPETCPQCLEVEGLRVENARLRKALLGLAIQGLDDDHPQPCFCDPKNDFHPTDHCERARRALGEG